MGTKSNAARQPDVINYSCPGCLKQLVAKSRLSGRRGFCSCGTVLIVPEADFDVPKKIGIIDLDAHDRFRRNCILVGITGLAAVIFLASVSYFIFRDTWEQDNRLRLLALCSKSDTLIASRDFEAAKSVQDELKSLIGTREILDQEMASTISRVSQTADSVNKKAAAIRIEKEKAEAAKALFQQRAESEANLARFKRQQELTAAREADRVTYRKFSDVNEGMETYEVWEVMKDSGELISSGSSGGYRFETRMWKNDDGSNMLVTYMNGKVTSKAQTRLPY